MSLSGPRQKFAEGIASGLNQTHAYRAAYPRATEAAARANAVRMIANESVAAEIERLREAAKRAADGPVLTLADKLRYLAEVVRTPVGEVGPDSHLVQEWREDTTGDGKRTVVKMPCKLRALELHAKLSGEFSEKVQVSSDTIIKVSIGEMLSRVIT